MAAIDALSIFDRLDRALWLVTAQDGTRRGGLIATFVGPASIVPEVPRIIVGLANHHHTRGLVESSGALALHLIGENHLDWLWTFALRSGHDGEKFHGLATHSGPTGSPILADALAWLDCHVEARFDIGDRTLYLADVIDSRVLSADPPLTVQRMAQLATPDQLRQLDEIRHRDRATDAAAIRQWRIGGKKATDGFSAP